MADTSLTDFLSAILEEHAEPVDPDMPAIVHAVHDNFQEDEQSVRAVVARYSGTYLQCTTVDGLVNVGLGAPNSSFLPVLTAWCEKFDLPIAVEQDGSQFRLTSTRFGGATGASITILNLLTALLSQEIDEPLVVISYDFVSLDERSAEMLWGACDLLGSYAPPRLRTLVPVAVGRVDIPTHCNPPKGSVRFVVKERQLFRRNLRRLSDDTLSAMIRDRDDPLVLFLGAGASASARMPDGNRLRDFALQELVGELGDHAHAVQLFRDYLTTHSRWLDGERDIPEEVFARDLTLERVMREEFKRLGGSDKKDSAVVKKLRRDADAALEHLPIGREALWELVPLLPRMVIATVNFDQLIEMGMTAEHFVVATPEEFEARRPDILQRFDVGGSPLPVLKVHGTIDRPETIVADVELTEAGLDRRVTETLAGLVRGHGYVTWVWIGCSMRDLDIEQWLKTVDGNTEIKEYWVDPLPPPSVARYAQRRRSSGWALSGISLRERQITESSDIFLRDMKQHVAALP